MNKFDRDAREPLDLLNEVEDVLELRLIQSTGQSVLVTSLRESMTVLTIVLPDSPN